MRRVVVLAVLLAACFSRKAPESLPTAAPRVLATPRTVDAPRARSRVVNRCPRVAPYDQFLVRVPWQDAACLKLSGGDRVYELPPVSGSSAGLFVVKRASDPNVVPAADLVWIIGYGPPVPVTVGPTVVTFHFKRANPRAAMPADNVRITILTGQKANAFGATTPVLTETIHVAADDEVFDYDYTFSHEQLLNWIGAQAVGSSDEWEFSADSPTVNGVGTIRQVTTKVCRLNTCRDFHGLIQVASK